MGDGDDAAVAALRRGDATLGGAAFAALVRAGCGSIVANKAELNTINVFPVADGDTGTNMAMAAKGMAKRAKKIKGGEGIGDVAAAVAEACVLSAQGNSGT